MEFSNKTVVVLALLVVVLAIAGSSQLTWAYAIPPASDSSERAMIVKRSLCNTFGGCGAKRSMQLPANNEGRQQQQQQQQQQYELPVELYSASSSNSAEPWSSASVPQNRRDSSFERATEIVNDLVEYLKTSEKYKQGKYIVLVPKPSDFAKPSVGTSHFNVVNLQELPQSGGHISYPYKYE